MSPASIKASTQEHLNIEDIQDNLVILKNGACCLILQITAINFGLLSEVEQDAIIYAYAGLLNSLTFPIQITIRSKKKDISSYLNLLAEQEKKLKKPALKEQLKKYRAFVEETVKKNEVLDKKFYISIPFSSLELGITSALSQTFKPKKGLPHPKSYILEKAKINLYPKKDHLTRQADRLGLRSKQLNTQELLELFYNVYNPESVGQAFVPAKDYKVNLVEPAVAGKKPEERKEPMDVPSEPIQTNAPTTPGAESSSPQTPTRGPTAPTTTAPGVPSPTTQTPSIVKSEEDVADAAKKPQVDNDNPQEEIDQAAKEVDSTTPAAASPAAAPPAPPQPLAPTGEQTKVE